MKPLKSRLGFTPHGILDVGADSGEWALLAKAEWPESYIMCVEENKAHDSSLRATEFSYRIAKLNKSMTLDELFPDDVFDLIKVKSSMLDDVLIGAQNLLDRAKALVVLSDDSNQRIYKL